MLLTPSLLLAWNPGSEKSEKTPLFSLFSEPGFQATMLCAPKPYSYVCRIDPLVLQYVVSTVTVVPVISSECHCRSLQGQSDNLNSAFHLTYNMVLNLLRVEEVNPEYMLERSFFQFQNNSSIPGLDESELRNSSAVCLQRCVYISMHFST